MGLKVLICEGVAPPELTLEGTYDENRGEILLPRGAFSPGVGGFLFDEVSDDGKLTESQNRFWLKFSDIKYIKTTEDDVIFRNWELCPDCDVIDDVFKLNSKKEIKRYCKRCGKELIIKD